MCQRRIGWASVGRRDVCPPDFQVRLDERSRRVGSYLCVGLDPDLAKLPDSLPRTPEGALAFNLAIVEATHDIAACYKPNFAFYEALGPEGWRVLAETVRAIQPDIPVIADAKRGDVGHTARAYARSLFETYRFSCATVNPLLGRDSVAPFLDYAGCTVLLVARTSNPGAAELQNLEIDGIPLYLHIVRASQRWGHADRIGYVVGATAPDELAAVREAAPDAMLLVPGVGEQGGDAERVVRSGAAERGGGLAVNVSRSILYAGSGRDFAQRARVAARRYADLLVRRA